MVLPRRVRSYNKRGGHWAEYRERQAWAQMLSAALVVDDGSLPRPVIKRMTLRIIRLAPTKRYTLDGDNYSAGAKRLIDSLVKAGFLVDDDRRWVDGPVLEQQLAADKCYWTIVVLTEAEQQEAPALKIVHRADFAKMRSPNRVRRRLAPCLGRTRHSLHSVQKRKAA